MLVMAKKQEIKQVKRISTRDRLIKDIDAFMVKYPKPKMSDSRLGLLAGNNSKLVSRVRDKELGLTLATVDSLDNAMDAYTADNLPTPLQ